MGCCSDPCSLSEQGRFPDVFHVVDAFENDLGLAELEPSTAVLDEEKSIPASHEVSVGESDSFPL